jgi:hypothetical protein
MEKNKFKLLKEYIEKFSNIHPRKYKKILLEDFGDVLIKDEPKSAQWNPEDDEDDFVKPPWWELMNVSPVGFGPEQGGPDPTSLPLCGQTLDYGTVSDYFFSMTPGYTPPSWMDLNEGDYCNSLTNASGGIPQEYICCSITNDHHTFIQDGFELFGAYAVDGGLCYCPSSYCEDPNTGNEVPCGDFSNGELLMHCNNNGTGIAPLESDWDLIDGLGVTMDEWEGIPGNTVNHFHAWVDLDALADGDEVQISDEGVWQFNDNLSFGSECYGCTNENATNFIPDAGYTSDPVTLTQDLSCEFDWCYIEGVSGDGTNDNTAYFCLTFPEYCGDSTGGEALTAFVTENGLCAHEGCLDPNYGNYVCGTGMPLADNATVCSGGTHIAGAITWIEGDCTDEFVVGCLDPTACNYNELANTPGSCEYTSCAGCTDPDAYNYNEDATIENNGDTAPYVNTFIDTAAAGCCYIAGCMDDTSTIDDYGATIFTYNYNANACYDDGTYCDLQVPEIPGCPEPLAANYNPNNPANVMDENGCDMTNLCMDPLSEDYVCYSNPELCVNTDYLVSDFPWSDQVDYGMGEEYFYIISINDPDYTWPDNYLGDTYDFGVDFPNCTYPAPGGCTDPTAINYDDTEGLEDDGSCAWYFCNDPNAFNYYDGISPYGTSWTPESVPCPGNTGCPEEPAEYLNDGTYIPGGCIFEGCNPNTTVTSWSNNQSFSMDQLVPGSGASSTPGEAMSGVVNEMGMQIYTMNEDNWGCQPGEDDSIENFPDPQNAECCYVPGCMLEEAYNYQDYHTVGDDEKCCLRFACTDPNALNYDADCITGNGSWCCPFGTGMHDNALADGWQQAYDDQGFSECEYPKNECADVIMKQCSPAPVSCPGSQIQQYPEIQVTCTDPNLEPGDVVMAKPDDAWILQGRACSSGFEPGEIPVIDTGTGGGAVGCWFDPNATNNQGEKGLCRWAFPGATIPEDQTLQDMPIPENGSSGPYTGTPSIGSSNSSADFWWKWQTPNVTDLGMNANMFLVESTYGAPQEPYPDGNDYGTQWNDGPHFVNDNNNCDICKQWCWQNRPVVYDQNQPAGAYIYGTMTPLQAPGTGANSYVYAACAEVGYSNAGDFDIDGEGGDTWWDDVYDDFGPPWQDNAWNLPQNYGHRKGQSYDDAKKSFQQAYDDAMGSPSETPTMPTFPQKTPIDNQINESKRLRSRVKNLLLENGGCTTEDFCCDDVDCGDSVSCCCTEDGYANTGGPLNPVLVPVAAYSTCMVQCCGSGCACEDMNYSSWEVIEVIDVYEDVNNERYNFAPGSCDTDYLDPSWTPPTVPIQSDIRLKENINKTGISKSGIPIYTFNYKNDNTLWSGTMAQDLLSMGINEAVSIMDNGYYGVNYNKIDVDFKKL